MRGLRSLLLLSISDTWLEVSTDESSGGSFIGRTDAKFDCERPMVSSHLCSHSDSLACRYMKSHGSCSGLFKAGDTTKARFLGVFQLRLYGTLAYGEMILASYHARLVHQSRYWAATDCIESRSSPPTA